MTLVVHDTLQRRKVPFEPLEPGKVRMYHCGPTVYSPAHIGNMRSFLFADVLRRWLETSGYEVTQVMNITDVGHLRDDDPDHGADKMEQAARAEKLDPWQIAAKYTELFMHDLRALRFRLPQCFPRATEHIPQMIAQIERLIAKGHAYVVGHEVYYAVESFPRYGALSGNQGDDLIAGARVAVHEAKRDPRDFALWKHDPAHLMQWDSPWGRGFPGWHIECSAMSQQYLGTTFDIHTGGEDNIFPHHECEIAQAEGASDAPFVRYWMHARHLKLEGGKMSKSAGTFYTVGDLVEMGHAPEAVRFLLIRSQYRQVLNFTLDGLAEAAGSIRRLRLFEAELLERADGAAPGEPPAWVAEAVRRFDASMDDDLNMSGALDGVFTLLNEGHRHQPKGADAASALSALRRFDEVFGVLPLDASSGPDDAEVDALVNEREAARAAKNWTQADRIRDRLQEMGIELLDGRSGSRWRRL
ncbi:MAG: cysteine--tRNA ligase [Planctomycetes bacterium]|nr:cysteine--tRNA ligase [Planctomycetota bacterium]